MISHLLHAGTGEKADLRIRRLRIETENAEALSKLAQSLAQTSAILRGMTKPGRDLDLVMRDVFRSANDFKSSLSSSAAEFGRDWQKLGSQRNYRVIFDRLNELKKKADEAKTEMAKIYLEEGGDPEKTKKRLEALAQAGTNYGQILHSASEEMKDLNEELERKTKNPLIGSLGSGIHSLLSDLKARGTKGLFSKIAKDFAGGLAKSSVTELLTGIGVPAGLAKVLTNPWLLVTAAVASAAREGAKLRGEVMRVTGTMGILSTDADDVASAITQMGFAFGMSVSEATQYVEELQKAGLRIKEIQLVQNQFYQNQRTMGIGLQSQLKLYSLMAHETRRMDTPI